MIAENETALDLSDASSVKNVDAANPIDHDSSTGVPVSERNSAALRLLHNALLSLEASGVRGVLPVCFWCTLYNVKPH